MKTQALKGMRDLLPAEQTLRDYIQGKILETYRASGFERISTPMLEDMENLDKSDGGDNLNLIFKVLKRGDKLTAALNTGDPKQLSDTGLRYDLTLPLSRYYAANKDKLPNPFKVIQTDRVFRAERPQKGRLREFVQCDIDILGDASPNAEVELIDVTTRALLNIGFTGFTVNINDRRILRGMLESMGFAADTLDSVCITFDKMDKIGAEGVKAELTEKQLPENAIHEGFATFRGTDRRFQYKGTYHGAKVIDDYAHHPTEIRATMEAAENCAHRTLWCVFQPHTYTRTKALLDDFAAALSLADHVVLADIYAARETDTLGISSKDIQERIVKLGTACEYFPSFAEIENYLNENLAEGDMLITMGAGDVVKIGEELLASEK